MSSARFLAGSAVVAALALQACSSQTASAQRDPAVPVSVAVARTTHLAQTREVSGTLTALHSATLGAASAGRVLAVNVRVGDRVSAGQVLAQIDASQYAADLAGARAGAAAAADSRRAAQAQVAQAQSRLRLAQITASRMSQLYAEGAISKQQRDQTQADLAAAQAQTAQAQASLSAAGSTAAQAGAGVQAASVPLQNASIVAPYSGVVTQKFVDPGAVVGAGSPVVQIQDTGALEIDAAVSEDDAGALRPGLPVTVRVDALGGARVPASVRAIVPSQNPGLRSPTVEIAVSPRPGLLPGMFARVEFPANAHEGVAVPLSAVVTRAGQSGVFAVRNGTASFIPVETGASTDRLVEVRGLHAGTHIAVSGLSRLTDGAPVRVQR